MKGKLDARDIQLVLNAAEQLHQYKDIDLLLDGILKAVRGFTSADAGSIYLKEENRLKFSYVQNETLLKRGEWKKYLYVNHEIEINTDSIAGYVACTQKPLLLEDVYNLPANCSFRFNRSFDQNAGYQTKSVLTVPLLTADDQLIGVLQLINAQNEPGQIRSFNQSDLLIVSYFASIAAQAIEQAQMTRQIILRMVKMAEYRDPTETTHHVRRVAAYSRELYESYAQFQGIPQQERQKFADLFHIAAMLHDVGKVAIPDQILKKNGELTAEERKIICAHTIFGARLFLNSDSQWDRLALEVSLNHHEEFAGGGYPGKIKSLNAEPLEFGPGKKGAEIPLGARIVAIADVYDALITPRSYKKNWSEQEVLDYLVQNRAIKFDPQLLDIFFDNYDLIRTIRKKFEQE